MTHRRTAVACALISVCTTVLGSSFVTRSNAAPSKAEAVPILMYHVVTAAPPGAAYPALFVSRSDFAAQMRWLAKHGYHVVTLRQAYESWHGRGPLPTRPVVLTFDDGYRSVYTNALPILRSHRWSGVLNLTVRNNGGIGGLSTWKVRQLLEAGWELDSHSLTHPDLTRLAPSELEAQVSGSRRALQRRFGAPVDFFCYPAGRYNRAVVAAVKAAGYVGATTTRYGLARPHERFALPRVRVNAGESGAELGAELRDLGA